MTGPAPHAEPTATTILGVRRAAAAEVLVFYAAALVFDAVALGGDRFRELSPHPFWLFVLVVAAHYGTATGVFAAVLGTLLAFLGNLPPRPPLIDQSTYLLSVIGQPVLWFASAVVLGELRARREAVIDAQREEIASLSAENHNLSVNKMALEMNVERLQAAAAGQVQTALSLVQAARTVDIQRTDSVFESVDGLIANLFQPTAYSIYLRTGDALDLIVHTTDGKTPAALQRYERGSPLFDAVVGEGKVVHVAAPGGEAVLGHDGVIAGPLLDGDTGDALGMLKIEGLPITSLGQGTVHAFKMLSEWIGNAYHNARRFEEANRSRVTYHGSQLFTDAYYRPVSAFIVALAERAHFEVSQLTLRVEAEVSADAAGAPSVTTIVEGIVTEGLRSTDLAFDYQRERGEFVIILPMTQAKNCQLVADRLRERVRSRLGEAGHHARVSITYETLHTPTANDIKPWHRAVIRRTDPYSS
jgi:hypothetical protein